SRSSLWSDWQTSGLLGNRSVNLRLLTMRRGFPASFSRLFGDLCPALFREVCGANLSALGSSQSAPDNRCRVFPLFLWHRFPVINLPGRHVDYEFGGLGEVPRALWVLFGHRANYGASRPACK